MKLKLKKKSRKIFLQFVNRTAHTQRMGAYQIKQFIMYKKLLSLTTENGTWFIIKVINNKIIKENSIYI